LGRKREEGAFLFGYGKKNPSPKQKKGKNKKKRKKGRERFSLPLRRGEKNPPILKGERLAKKGEKIPLSQIITLVKREKERQGVSKN